MEGMGGWRWEFCQSGEGFGVALGSGLLEPGAGERFVLGDAIALDIQFRKLHGGFTVAGLHLSPQLIRVHAGLLIR